MSIVRRGSTFHLRRRVPRRPLGVEPCGTVWISLHADSAALARARAERAWGQMVEAWEARLAGDTGDAETRHAAALTQGGFEPVLSGGPRPFRPPGTTKAKLVSRAVPIPARQQESPDAGIAAETGRA